MKNRQYKIMELIYQNQNINFNDLLEKFNISKRTLYYDIDDINWEIKEFGQIKKANNSLFYVGSEELEKQFNFSGIHLDEIRQRRLKITEYIFTDNIRNLDSLSEELEASKTTIFSDIEYIRGDLKENGIGLLYDKEYVLVGLESNIRDYYLNKMILDENLLNYIDKRIYQINQIGELHLSDLSVSILSKYLSFLENRIKKGLLLEIDFTVHKEIKDFDYYKTVEEIIGLDNENETMYLVGFMASLSNLKSNCIENEVHYFVNALIDNFQKLSAVEIDDQAEFKEDLRRHLQSSYYRIKYCFPIFNPSLYDIKANYGYLFNLIKDSVIATNNEIFSQMRDAEIGFLVMYFGTRMDTFTWKTNKVIIVCPNGVMISRLVENQIAKYFPTIDIKGLYSLSELNSARIEYDYIISTIDLIDMDNVIVVKPILTSRNIAEISEKLINFSPMISENRVNDLIEIINNNANITNEERLRNELLGYFAMSNKIKAKEQPMLSDLLTRERIVRERNVDSWEDAIKDASQVLIEDGSIEPEYVDSMIASVMKNGPYIVLEDGFAMPHSNKCEFVNKLSMSLLILDESVDLLGKDVSAFLVLATVDTNSHLKALASLSEILGEDENMEILKHGNDDQIIELVTEKEERE